MFATKVKLVQTALVKGDRVGVSGRHDWNDGFGVVAKVTPTGMVTLEGGWKFNAKGEETSPGFGGVRLVPVAEMEERMAAREARVARNLRFTALANLVNSLVGGAKNGHGDYVGAVSEEEKAKLVALVNAL